MNETEKIIKSCTDCGACVRSCTFLKHYCDSPKELAKRYKRNPLENIEIPYSCSLCGLCKRVCPVDLNPGDMCLETRQKIFKTQQGKHLPDDFIYDYIITKFKGIKYHQIMSSSSLFTYSKKGENKVKSLLKRVFFPGCSLSAYSPDLVLKAYKYLLQVMPGTGIILNCCGKPGKDIGDNNRFHTIFNKTIKEFSRLGITEIVVACINCHKIFRENSDIKLKSIYEVIAEKDSKITNPHNNTEITIHDSCPARYSPKIRKAVRAIALNKGFKINEMKLNNEFTQCCGAGGCSPMGNRTLSDRHTKTRAKQVKGKLISYCAHCREKFSSYTPSLHILDLYFGVSHRQHIKEYHDSWRNWLNRWYLKKRLQMMKL